MVTLQAIVADLAGLRTKLNTGEFGTSKISTASRLGVHPGLSEATTARGVRQAMKDLLEKYISAQRLMAVAAYQLKRASVRFLTLANAVISIRASG